MAGVLAGLEVGVDEGWDLDSTADVVLAEFGEVGAQQREGERVIAVGFGGFA